MQHIEIEDPNKPPNHTNKHSSQQVEADSGRDFAAEKPESHSPEKHEKKKKRKKREIQLNNGAEAVTGDDLAVTEVVEDAPSSSKSGDKKSKKRKKEYDVAAGGVNGAAEMSGTTNRDGSDDTKDTEAVIPEELMTDEKKMSNAMTANTKNGVEEALSVTKSSDKKSKKRDREKGVAATANVSDSGKEHASNANDVVAGARSSSKSDDKKSRKRKKENDVLAGGENSTAKIGEEGLDDSIIMKPVLKKKRNKEKDVGVGGSGQLGESGTAEMGGSGKEGDSDDSATSKPRPKKKRNKGKDVVDVGTEADMSNASKTGASDNSQTANPKTKKPSKPRKRVSFAGEVEVFDDEGKSSRPEEDDDALVQGKRFTPEEDDIIKEAVRNYIQGNQLGEEGLQMVLNNKKHSHLIGCWKKIGASLPWRPFRSVYFRAHTLFDRSAACKWQPHEYETLTRLHEQFGPDWKIIGAELGRHRIQVKETWRWLQMANRNRGNWSQEEYQSLFDLVNLDLAMKAFDEKKTKHGMLRDNISWKAISAKLSTRMHSACSNKWYRQLSSPLVSQGLWLDTDDYRLLDAPGNICRKRWEQMVRHIGGHREKSFIEQLDVLSNRYCPEMLEYRKDEGCSNATPLATGTSPREKTGHDT